MFSDVNGIGIVCYTLNEWSLEKTIQMLKSIKQFPKSLTLRAECFD